MGILSKRISLRGVDRGALAPTVGCALALATALVASSLINRHALVPGTLGGPFGMLCAAVGYGLLALASYYRPQALMHRGASLAAAVAAFSSGALMLAGAGEERGAFAVAGAVLYELSYVWMMFLFVCRIVSLDTLKAATVAVVCGVILRQLALPLYSLPMGSAVALTLAAVLCAAVIAGLALLGSPPFAVLARRESLEQLELTNPLSSLRPPALLFVGVFAVSLTYGFACAFGVPGLATGRLAVVVLLFALLWLLLVQREGQEDRLFSLCVLFIMAGLLATALVMGGDNFAAHTLLFLGSTCFDILLWLLMYSLGRRNIVAMLPCFGVAHGLGMLGRCAGDLLGAAALAAADPYPRGSLAVTLGLALLFFVFVWLGFRRFSFTDAICAVERIEARGAAAEDFSDDPAPQATRQERQERRLRELAEGASLTAREVEVFELLARGRNARFIMDELHVTRNTAKAHIAHIYTKLGVHSHQELLSLVEE